MNQWLLTKTQFSFANQFDRQIFLLAGYCLYFTLPTDLYFYDVERKSGIFVFGYYISRLNSNINYKNLYDLFLELSRDPRKSHKIIKGMYTIVLIQEGSFSVFNDPLGLSKFYYSLNKEDASFAGRIRYIIQIGDATLSKEQLLAYYVFNYSLNGNTFFNNIKYSTPGLIFFINENGAMKSEQYFDFLLNLSQPKDKIKKKSVFEYAPQLWLDIIKQWQEMLKRGRASLTLTAGLDSRIILGSFIKTGYSNYDTFTFGHPESLDVDYAKLIAKEYNIRHQHFYPEEDFFTNFAVHAKKVFENGDTLVSIYRAHRLMAYSRVMQNSDAIVMGLAGSDLVRGFGYDGLIVSPIAYHCLNKKSFESYFNDPKVVQHLQNLGFTSIEWLFDHKKDFDYLSHNLQYLFKVIIPLHFSQDILMNSNMEWKTVVPFLDLDYLEFLRQNPYFGIYDYNHFKSMDLIRRTRGLYYSAKLSHNLHKELSAFGIGKGISPNDIVISPAWAFTKGYLNKISRRNKNYVVNFAYGEWFWQYLYDYFKEHNLDEIGMNQGFLLKKLNNIDKEGGELHFLDFVKALNIHMASEL